MEDVKIVDFVEVCGEGKVIIKLSKENISQLLNGKILKGFKTRVGMDIELNNKEDKK